jgi:hypothetical protein
MVNLLRSIGAQFHDVFLRLYGRPLCFDVKYLILFYTFTVAGSNPNGVIGIFH